MQPNTTPDPSPEQQAGVFSDPDFTPADETPDATAPTDDICPPGQVATPWPPNIEEFGEW